MRLPNGNLFAKTIGCFDNEQVVGATKLMDSNKELKDFILDRINEDYTPLFEYVSWDNRIVLKYYLIIKF